MLSCALRCPSRSAAQLVMALALLAQGCATGAASVAPAPAGPAPAASPLTRAQVQSLFERFQSLAGDWKGSSTKGWTETASYKSIASGSAVMESTFGAHDNEAMVTMIHPDGDRLLLTHYCAARNQPRLQ